VCSFFNPPGVVGYLVSLAQAKMGARAKKPHPGPLFERHALFLGDLFVLICKYPNNGPLLHGKLVERGPSSRAEKPPDDVFSIGGMFIGHGVPPKCREATSQLRTVQVTGIYSGSETMSTCASFRW